MTIYQTIKELEKIALSTPQINFCGENDLYAIINSNPNIQYSIFFVTQNQHKSTEDWDKYNLNLFYIDRLLEDNSNELAIQSIGKEILTNIVRIFCGLYDAEVDGQYNWQPFMQKFNDNCAGVYLTITLDIAKDSICPEEED